VLCFQDVEGGVDMARIQARLSILDHRMGKSDATKRKHFVLSALVQFLTDREEPKVMSNCTPEDIRQFLVWKDCFGKTQVHKLDCRYFGSSVRGDPCTCPLRLAAGTVEGMINTLIRLFDDHGFGRVWDSVSLIGNPACAPLVRNYLKLIREEQAQSNVLPKQAKPLFVGKLRSIFRHIDDQLCSKSISLRDRYVLLRDQAWFKLQFFAGDRAGDLSMLVSQQVRSLQDGTGFAVTHTFGKTLRGTRGRINEFVVLQCDESLICPVRGLQKYVSGVQLMGVSLSPGYLFRIVSEAGVVLDQNVSYSVVYERLRHYLMILGLYAGETPHSFRAGCAVSLGVAGCTSRDMMHHIGWFGEASASYYSREQRLRSSRVARRLRNAVDFSDEAECFYDCHADFQSLPHAF